MSLSISRNSSVQATHRAAAQRDGGEESGRHAERDTVRSVDARDSRDTVELSARSRLRVVGDRPLAEIVAGLRAAIETEERPASGFPPLGNAVERSGEDGTTPSSPVPGRRDGGEFASYGDPDADGAEFSFPTLGAEVGEREEVETEQGATYAGGSIFPPLDSRESASADDTTGSALPGEEPRGVLPEEALPTGAVLPPEEASRALPEGARRSESGLSPESAVPAGPVSARPVGPVLPPPSGHRSSPAASGHPETPGAEPVREGEENGKSEPDAFGRESLTPEEQRQVEKLKARDREVRAHEQAHMSAAGSYARGGPSYEYETGPDDRRYAVGGEVSIDTAPVPDDPEATIRKAQVIRRAAMAPAEPSGQDHRVAAQAGRMESQARQELSRERMEEMQGTDDESAAEGALEEEEVGGSTDSDGDTGRAEISGEADDGALEPEEIAGTYGESGLVSAAAVSDAKGGIPAPAEVYENDGGAIPEPGAVPEIRGSAGGAGGVATLKRFSSRIPAVGGAFDLTV